MRTWVTETDIYFSGQLQTVSICRRDWSTGQSRINHYGIGGISEASQGRICKALYIEHAVLREDPDIDTDMIYSHYPLSARQHRRDFDLDQLMQGAEWTGEVILPGDMPVSRVVCEHCGWGNPSLSDVEQGIRDGEVWFCHDCAAAGYDHVESEQEIYEWFMATEHPKIYAELWRARHPALRFAADPAPPAGEE